MTKLEGSYPIVLGHNWLTQNNPSINWKKGTIVFSKTNPENWLINPQPKSKPPNPLSPTKPPVIWHLAVNQPSEDQPLIDQTMPTRPQISLVNITAFRSACKSKGAISFQITPYPKVVTGLAAWAIEIVPEIPGLSKDYYGDVFSTQKTKLLPEHWPYDLAIYIEGDKTSSLGPIYSLSVLELQTLQEFLEENTKTGIIYLFKSPYSTPVLFVKKKDRTLCLCVDY